MLISQIGLVSLSRTVDLAALTRVANALNLQFVRDLSPLWPVSGVVVALADERRLDPGIWPIYVVDELEVGGAGFHLTEHNQPYAVVKAGPSWSLKASHEAIQMAVDPTGNRLVAAPALRIVNTETADAAGIVEYLVEACSQSLDSSGAYLIDGVLVSDFYTPRYFDAAAGTGVRYSFSGRVTRPRQVLPNGALTWFDPATNKLRRLHSVGAPEIVDLAVAKAGSGSLTGGSALRAFVDRKAGQDALAALPASDRTIQRREAVATGLASVGIARAALFAIGVKRPAPVQAPTQPMTGRRSTDIPVGAVDGSAPPSGDRRKNVTYEKVRTVIFSNAVSLTLPGILSVRPGLHFGPEGFTNERVVVVKATPNTMAGLRGKLPQHYGDVRVEVRAADPLERLRARNGTTYLQVAAARHELRAPVFDDALYLDGAGTTVDDATVAAAALGAQVAKRQIDYTPPPNVSLAPLTDTMTLVLHVSPDAGWAELSRFLESNTGDLVVGMHDFTSSHVRLALERATQNRRLTLTLDRPAPTPGSDQSGEEVRQALTRKLGRDFQGAWALTNADAKASVWVFPNAYHVKAAVRDDDTLWLSTGDWNNGNLPRIDVNDAVAAGKIAANSDRDWHVIVTNKALADTFRRYLAHDHAVASAEEAKVTSTGVPGATAAALPMVPTDAFTMGHPPKRFFAAKTVTVTARVQPLWTPDNYQPLVKALVESAKQSFYMQTQYIHPSGKEGDRDFDALIAAVSQLVAAGVDVRLITSAYQTDDWMEKLAMKGIPSSVIRRQPGVHNNGIVVDHQSVMIGSQNWSADGVLRNRDAGLIVHDATVADYFERVFLHDWEHLAAPVVG